MKYFQHIPAARLILHLPIISVSSLNSIRWVIHMHRWRNIIMKTWELSLRSLWHFTFIGTLKSALTHHCLVFCVTPHICPIWSGGSYTPPFKHLYCEAFILKDVSRLAKCFLFVMLCYAKSSVSNQSSSALIQTVWYTEISIKLYWLQLLHMYISSYRGGRVQKAEWPHSCLRLLPTGWKKDQLHCDDL